MAVPVMAKTTMNGATYANNGYGPGNGTDAGNNDRNGDCISAVFFRLNNTTLLARGGKGGGNGGNGGGKGDCDGSGSGDRDGDKIKDRDRYRDGSCTSCS